MHIDKTQAFWYIVNIMSNTKNTINHISIEQVPSSENLIPVQREKNIGALVLDKIRLQERYLKRDKPQDHGTAAALKGRDLDALVDDEYVRRRKSSVDESILKEEVGEGVKNEPDFYLWEQEIDDSEVDALALLDDGVYTVETSHADDYSVADLDDSAYEDIEKQLGLTRHEFAKLIEQDDFKESLRAYLLARTMGKKAKKPSYNKNK